MAETTVVRTNSEEETRALGRRIGKNLGPGSIVSLSGPLGSGKTVIAKGVAEALEITEPIVSPTFTLIQEYCGKLELYHMDLYRLEGADDFAGIGGEELLYAGGVSLIEWSEKIADMLPESTIKIVLAINDDGSRTVAITGVAL
jgi:tRNA threonylcarbamoyladenosine biosynthesis protein TsaE